ncbi:MAG: DUF1905 domain-containing protein [Bacteroidetes bacterium]|nr:MAG: DUF1905 domain-containing protein [Bacteroidota bacterium]
MEYRFSGLIWKYNSPGGWFFVSVPADLSQEIRSGNQWLEEGWGRLKVKATIAGYQWDTAIWFDTKLNCYLLPLKADVRKRIDLKEDVVIEVSIRL